MLWHIRSLAIKTFSVWYWAGSAVSNVLTRMRISEFIFHGEAGSCFRSQNREFFLEGSSSRLDIVPEFDIFFFLKDVF